MLKESVRLEEAKQIILNNTRELGTEVVFTPEAAGRHVASDITAPFSLPSADNSAMDGFALFSEDIKEASKDNPITLRVIDEIYAGKMCDTKLTRGCCVRIFTGAKIPPGADTVVRQEDVIREGEYVTFFAPQESGVDIRKAGDDVKKGQRILKKGDIITPPAIGLLTALNIAKVTVFRKPKVFIVATGNELLELGSQLVENKIINSNSYALFNMCLECGATPVYGGITNDDENMIMSLFEKAKNADIVVTTGGVSVGEYDLVKDAFAKKGVEWLFWKVKIRPGHPVAFGIFENRLFFGLPGNPVSSMITFDQFVRPAILAMMGAIKTERLRFYATSEDDIKKKPDRTHFLRAIVYSKDGELSVKVMKNQSSAAISTMLDANCYIILEEGRTKINKGEKVLVEVFKLC